MLAYRVFVLCYALWISVCSSSTLPSNLIVGYAGWGECDEKIVKAAQDGVNVVIWFAINLLADEETGVCVMDACIRTYTYIYTYACIHTHIHACSVDIHTPVVYIYAFMSYA